MEILPQVLINGLTVGATYALAAIGVSLIFGILNIVNFGHAAPYTLGAFFALVLLHTLGLNLAVAYAIAVVGAALVGYLIERVAVRPLRDTVLLMPLISTLGMGIFFENLMQFIFGPANRPFPTPVALAPIEIWGTTITAWEVATLVIAVLAIGALQMFLHQTSFGKAVRAITEDRRMAELLGIDVNRVIVITFCIASGLGGLAGILDAALYNSVHPFMGSASMLKAFAASVLGGMEVIAGAIIGGLLLGVVESISSVYLSSAWRNGIALLVIVCVLLFKPTGLLGHRQLEKVERSSVTILPVPPPPRISFRHPLFWVVLVALVVIPAVLPNQYVQRVLTTMAIFATLALSLNIVAGFAGIVSLSQAAFYGFGAYTSAILAVRLGFPFWLSFILATAATGLFGVAFAWPVMRLRGHYVAMGTLSLGALLTIVIHNWTDFTRGPMGIHAIPSPSVFGVELSALGLFYFSLILLATSAIVTIRMLDSSFGRSLLALRDDELGAASLGVDVRRLKMTAFGVSAAIAGACGSFWAHFMTFISPDSFSVMESINILAMVVIGGLGSIPGAIIGGAMLTGLPELLRFASEYRQAVYGLLMLLVVLFRPQGLFGVSTAQRRGRPLAPRPGEDTALPTPSVQTTSLGPASEVDR